VNICCFDLNRTIIAIESNTESIASILRSRRDATQLPDAATPPDIVFRINEGQVSPNPSKHGSFQNDEITFIVNERYLVVAYWRGHPWRIDIRSYDCSSEDLYSLVIDPLLLACVARVGQSKGA